MQHIKRIPEKGLQNFMYAKGVYVSGGSCAMLKDGAQ